MTFRLPNVRQTQQRKCFAQHVHHSLVSLLPRKRRKRSNLVLEADALQND